MAKKTFTTDLTIKGENTYSCSISKDYTEVFNLSQELDNTDDAIKMYSGATTKSTNTMASPQAILIKNTSDVAAEILINVQDYKNNSNTDAANSVDVGGGGATKLRSFSMLLPAQRFVFLPNTRMISYSSTDDGGASIIYQSAANAPVGAVSIEPKDINSGNKYRDVRLINSATYGTGTAVLVNDGDATATSTELTVDDHHWLKEGDKLMMIVGGEKEIVQITFMQSDTTITIARALDGSKAVVIADNTTLVYAFHNGYLPFDTSKVQTDANGRFKQHGAFFGYARTADAVVDGLVPGSVSIGPFYTEGGYLDWGLSGLTANTETGLAKSTTYTFHIVVDEFNAGGIDSLSNSPSAEVAIAFTTDASDTTFAGSANAVLPKIQAVLDEQFYTTSSGLNGKKVSIGLVNGDVRITSHSNHSDTIVGIANVSGTTPFGVGAFPPLASSVPDVLGKEVGGGTTDNIMYGPASYLAPETINDPTTGKSMTNDSAFIFDDGNGNLLYMGRKVGYIDYEKGHCEWHIPSLPNAEFKIHAESHSAHSGGSAYTNDGYNTIQEIRARSVNNQKDAKLQVISVG